VDGNAVGAQAVHDGVGHVAAADGPRLLAAAQSRPSGAGRTRRWSRRSAAVSPDPGTSGLAGPDPHTSRRRRSRRAPRTGPTC